jgi:hypothetical protein
VRAALDDPPSYSAVHGMLALLERHGFLRHEADGLRCVYLPVVAPAEARRSAMMHLVATGLRARVVVTGATSLLAGALAAVTPIGAGAVAIAASTAVVAAESILTMTTPAPQSGNGTLDALSQTSQAPRPAAPAGVAQTPARPCAGSLEQNSTSISSDGGRRTYTVTLSGPGCSVDLRARGTIVFTDDFTDVRSLDSDGYFRLDVTERGVRRQLELEMRDGTLARQWRVDGREQPYDAAARAWFGEFLVDLDRRTAIGVDVRLPHLLRQGGVDAVLADTAQMTSDYVRTRYYTALAAARPLSPADTARVLRQGASLTTSDYYASELLKGFAARGLQDATTRTAVIELIERLKSDHYKSESVAAFLGVGTPSAQETDFLLRMVPTIKSDHYKLQTLTRALAGTTLTRAQMDALVGAASSIGSDYYRAAYLKALLGAGALEGAAAVITLIDAMRSDHYRAESFAELLQTRGVGERDLLAVVSAAGKLSDHYTSQTLRAVVRHAAANERVRAAVLAAADSLSRHYADEVRRSVR